ncbi:MAG: alpha/beta hydrolase [Pelodictyon luteolum]|uniref:Alpha/beta hydrolase n=1 Tax=Pelodictyon luteolum TaxID=1100 RepID=A0A165LDH0_PELLU|nr:alpha/beta hydrolase [Pelodictyon luteolum]KZK73887.1 MAG: alpha/beta hydrolase [Pelodictyon luteolum]
MAPLPPSAPQTEKFIAYCDRLRRDVASDDRDAARRAAYELELAAGSRFIEVNGIVHHYHVSGPEDAKETIVLIHGWDCWWMWWHHVVHSLNKAGVRTIAYDMRGHGWSANDPSNHYHINSFAHDLDGLQHALGIERFHVAAFSFGALVALDYARNHSDRVRSMTFFNFGYLPNSEFIASFAPGTINFVFNIMLRKLTWWFPAYVFARLVLARNTVTQHDILIGFQSLGLCASEAIEQTTGQITAQETTDSVPDMVMAVSAPILFVAGEGDGIMTAENTRKLQEMTGKGRYVGVPECGHLITLELPDTASELILEQIRFVG